MGKKNNNNKDFHWYANSFWEVLEKHLKAKGRTLSWLCREGDIANANVYRYKSLGAIPSEGVLQKMAAVLETDVGTLKRGELETPAVNDAVEEYELKEAPPKRELRNPEPESDTVNSPAHYTAGSIECIDAIKAALTKDEFRGYLKGNILKYVWRESLKGGTEDMEKAGWYIARYLKEAKDE